MGKDLQASFWYGGFLLSTLTLVPDSSIRHISISGLLHAWMNFPALELEGPLSLDAMFYGEMNNDENTRVDYVRSHLEYFKITQFYPFHNLR